MIPHSSRTKDVLVIDLGKLSVTNAFIYDGQDGTLSRKHKNSMPSHSDLMPSVPAVTSSYSSTFDRDSVMNRSVYGSLDEDFRSSLGQEHPAEAAISNSAILSSFYSALGKSTTASVSSCIVLSNGSTPCVSTSRMDTGTHHSLSTASSYSGVFCPQSSSSRVCDDDADVYSCLLDVMHIELCDAEVYSACWKPRVLDGSQSVDDVDSNCLVFQLFIIQREVCMNL